MFYEEGYYACPLDHEGVKNSDASKRERPISNLCMKGITYTSLCESKFYDMLHDVFTLFLV